MSFKNSTMIDSIMQDMHSIMQSDSHKSLFEKKAQQMPAHNPSMHSPSSSVVSNPGIAMAPKSNSTIDNASLCAQLKEVQQSMTKDESGQQRSLSSYSKDEQKLNQFISYFCSGLANSGKPMGDGSAFSFQEFAKLLMPKYPTIAKAVEQMPGLQEQAKQTTKDISEKSASLISTLVKVADVLGESGYLKSEAAADALIKTLIVEAKKKKLEKEEKKMKKLEKKMKKDKCEDGKDCEGCKDCK